jgi:hypothetical protein
MRENEIEREQGSRAEAKASTTIQAFSAGHLS